MIVDGNYRQKQRGEYGADDEAGDAEKKYAAESGKEHHNRVHFGVAANQYRAENVVY